MEDFYLNKWCEYIITTVKEHGVAKSNRFSHPEPILSFLMTIINW